MKSRKGAALFAKTQNCALYTYLPSAFSAMYNQNIVKYTPIFAVDVQYVRFVRLYLRFKALFLCRWCDYTFFAFKTFVAQIKHQYSDLLILFAVVLCCRGGTYAPCPQIKPKPLRSVCLRFLFFLNFFVV